jgi:UDPglucose 6-dehydrogenase
MKISIYGTGYVGLVTGACLAEVGNDVLCMDIDQAKIDRLKSGEIPIFEPDLEPMVKRNVDAGRLQFTTNSEEAVRHGLFQFVAVGTPPDEDGSADLTHVLNVGRSIAQHLDDYRIVVDKSTVPVGTADKVAETMRAVLAERQVDIEFDVVSNPEFLKEGAAINDFMRPDRIVVGTDNPRTTALLRELYAPFNRSYDKFIAMDVRSAELTKYAANAMLATKISFMNEMANIAERLGADIEMVRQGIGSDSRIGYSFIYPGCGYGGSCFPKDVNAIYRSALQTDYEPNLLSAVELVNQKQKQVLFNKIKNHFDGELAGKTFAIWGLSFKPKTDDMREASSRTLMEALWAVGAKVRAFDPVAMKETHRIYGDRDDLYLAEDPMDAAEATDALVIVTEWNNFRSPDFDKLKSSLKSPIIFDGRNVYDPKALKARGFTYYGIGRQ